MDNPFRKLFGLKTSIWPPRSSDRTEVDKNVQGVAYELTSPASRKPIFISQPLRRSMTEQRAINAMEGLAMRAYSYESTLPGKPPIIGGRPHRGNGPVKLQTSRRLSSGELLATTQDPRRTMEDIRDGDYIVGGLKEKRSSRSSQMRSATPSIISPRSGTTSGSVKMMSPHLSLSSYPRSPVRGVSKTPSTRSPSLPIPSPKFQLIHPGDNPLMLSHAVSFTRQASLKDIESPRDLSSFEDSHDGNGPGAAPLIAWGILKRAEKTRLASMETLTEAAGDALPLQDFPSEKHESILLPSVSRRGSCQAVQLRRSVQNKEPFRFSQATVSHDNVQSEQCYDSDNVSDHSSRARSSLQSSQASSSADTGQTSLSDDRTTTREQVHRLIDDVRSKYLEAIESREARYRADAAKGIDTNHLPPQNPTSDQRKNRPKARHSNRRSWQSSEVTATASTNARRWASDQVDSHQGPPEMPLVIDEAAESKNAPMLQRADSLTLGSLMASNSFRHHEDG